MPPSISHLDVPVFILPREVAPPILHHRPHSMYLLYIVDAMDETTSKLASERASGEFLVRLRLSASRNLPEF